jgi:hypothetical protein
LTNRATALGMYSVWMPRDLVIPYTGLMLAYRQQIQLTSNFNYLPSVVKFDCNI